MKQILIFFLVFLINTSSYADSIYQIDFSAIDVFFDIASVLSEDRSPTEEQWEAFHQTGGYQFLSLDLERRIRIAFKPSEAKQRDSILAIGKFNFDTHTVQHLIEAYQHQSVIKAYQQETDFERLLREAHKKVKNFLPDRVDTDSSVPPLYFALFQPDAYAKDSVTVADMYIFTKLSHQALVETLAHEMYHYYRRQHAPHLSNKFFIKHNEFNVLKTLNKLHNEGVADLTDKSSPSSSEESFFTLALPKSFAEKYNKSFNETPQTLRKIDSLLLLAAVDTGWIEPEITQLLDFGGHPQGYYMSSLIKKEMGLKPLVDSFDNPAAFIRLYNEAAEKSKRPEFVFSSATIEYLEKLEAEHFKATSVE